MTNGEKILIAILLGITIIMFFVFNNNFNEIESSKDEEVDTILDYMNENKKENIQENQLVENKIEKQEESKIENTVVENQIENETKNNVVGKEEQESEEENIGLSNEQKAIKLAQDEWGISIDSYRFEAVLQNDEKYKVSVFNKTSTAFITSYIVDVDNETAIEQ